MLIRDMNLDAPATDARGIEVLANGLPLWQGAQAAVDTTLVSPFPVQIAELGARWRPRPVARRRKLVVVGAEVGVEVGGSVSGQARRGKSTGGARPPA